MDKRSLFFVFALTVVLMFTHNYFDSKKKPTVATQEQSNDYSARLASKSALPLFEMKSDTHTTWAVKVDGEYLSLAWGTNAPEEVAIKDGKRGSRKAFLEAGTRKVGEPVVYTTSKDPALTAAPLPLSGDLQLVSLDGDAVEVTLAEQSHGELVFPMGKPEGNAIALTKVGAEYLPVGIYSNGKLKPLTDFSNLKDIVSVETGVAFGKESFYVLENDSMQIVFSSAGGAISEINLPFISDENKMSVIRPIGFDAKIEKASPANALFPLFDYTVIENGNRTTKRPVTGGYYPLLRRGIVGENGFTVPPKNYALSLVSDGPIAQYSVTRLEKNLIVFEGRDGARTITKTYSFPKVDAPYCVELDVKINGQTQGLYLTSGVPEVELISGATSPNLKYRSTEGGKSSVDKIKLPKTTVSNTMTTPDWVSNSNGFFGLIVDHLDKAPSGFTATKIEGVDDPSRLTLIDRAHNLYPADKYPGYELLVPIGYNEQSFRLFAGPYDTKVLKAVDAALSVPSTGYTPNYIASKSLQGWFSFISEPFAKFLMLIMNVFYTVTGSWGISIILITIVLRLMLYPLNAWSIKSQIKMQAVAPQAAAIDARYKSDPKRAQLEKMQLYREKGANPLTGCIPLLIQMPFLIGMFDLLKSSFELRGASFIPGWINNLTAPDVLFSWSKPIIFFGTSFHLLPMLVGIVMFIQQKFSQAQSSAKGVTVSDQQKQQQKMGSIMTIVFTFIFYNFPSGLNLYWLSSISLGILQQWYTGKKTKIHTPMQPKKK